MTLQIRATAPLPSRADRLVAIKGQIAYFFGQDRGYFALDAGIRDDTASTGIQILIPSEDRPDIPNARTWHYYDPERPDLLDAAAEIALQKAETYGNVYLTRTLFGHKRATKDSAKPSRIIAVEDAPAALPLPASRVLRTSPQSRQSFYRLVEPVSTAKAEKLSRLIARAIGADRSGVNANKVLRLVAGLNTKKKCGEPFLVHVESRALDYTYQELWDTFAALLAPAEVAEVEAKSRKDRASIRLLRLVKTPMPVAAEMTRADARLQSVPMPQTANEPSQAIETHVGLRPDRGSDPAHAVAPPSTPADEPQQVGSSQTTLEPAALTLAQLVAEAVDAFGTEYRFGQIKPLDRVRAHVEMNSGDRCWPPAAVETVYRQELERRERQRDAARVEAMDVRALAKACKSAANAIARGMAAKPQRKPAELEETEDAYQARVKSWRKDRRALAYWRWYHGFVSEVLERKRAEMTALALLAPAPLLEYLEAMEAATPTELPAGVRLLRCGPHFYTSISTKTHRTAEEAIAAAWAKVQHQEAAHVE